MNTELENEAFLIFECFLYAQGLHCREADKDVILRAKKWLKKYGKQQLEYNKFCDEQEKTVLIRR